LDAVKTWKHGSGSRLALKKPVVIDGIFPILDARIWSL